MSRHVEVAIVMSMLACTASLSANAGERAQISSTVFGIGNVQPLDLGAKSHFVTVATEEIVITAGLDDLHPLQNISGQCGGSFESKEGIAKGNSRERCEGDY